MAYTTLKNAGLVSSDTTDFTKTKTVRLASEKIAKNLYRQVHLIKFTDTLGNSVEAITVNEVSNEECSMSHVEVFAVKEHYSNK